MPDRIPFVIESPKSRISNCDVLSFPDLFWTSSTDCEIVEITFSFSSTAASTIWSSTTRSENLLVVDDSCNCID